MEAQIDVDLEQARHILRGQYATPAAIWELVQKLKERKIFGESRKLLARARLDPSLNQDPKLRLKLCQQHALCTYKDPDLPGEFRFDRALEILREVEPLETTRNPETLGITGAIYKRKFEAFAQKPDLERALAYYLRGYNDGDREDYGYTGINAAFVLDVLGVQELAEARLGGAKSDTSAARIQQARRIREHLAARLPGLAQESETWLNTEWWYLVTLAEAHFGLGRYSEALVWLTRAAALNVPEWEFESTVSQLASLARLQAEIASPGADLSKSEAWKVIEQFLGKRAADVRGAFIGKVGLALSGGGFRASLFHIGVLARLAELDVLRSVEFLSCVSGGSIIGAHYYLEVRRLFRDKEDREITREDYIEIVRRLERDFLAGVQRNIRTRVAANPLTNLKMAFNPNHSRSVSVGELYESELYSKVQDGEGRKPRYLDELFILPKGEEKGLQPKYHNWRRRAKVPILILNGTSLNTGHNWQFTASWMGEPPAGIDAQIDGNYRLRRMYYNQAPRGFRKVRLGHAVAASACVPGLFEPITFDALYPSRVVRLVDGGVHDNQGTASLLENQCNVLLVSDASGQMETEDTPSSGLLGVPLRSNSILQARVRQAQYHELDARRSTLLLRGLMFVHLKKDLDVDPVDWVNCEDPYDASDESRSVLRRGELTTYGIRKDVQRCLAAVRTDLDSFSEVEAWALMTSGYRMTEREFPATIAGFDGTAVAAREPWRFLAVELPMQQRQGVDAAHEELMKLLGVSNALSLKVWKLSPALRLARAVALGLLALGYLAWCVGAIGANFDTIEVSQRSVGIFGLVLAAIPVVLAIARRLRFPGMQIGSSIFRAASGLSIGLVGWAFAWIHLAFFDPWYLRLGRVERLGLSTGDGVRTGRGSKRLAWTIFGLLVVVIGGFLAYPHYMAQTPTDTSMALIAGSYAKRQAGNYAGAIADLSQGLESPKSKWTAQMYRDRAYCYRLQGNWEKSIADLTTALGMEAGGSQGMLSLLKQRAFAYVQVRDPELALKDYDAALNILPGDAEAKLGQFSLGLVLREPVAKPPFRVIVGQAIDSSEKLPLAVLLLQPKFTKFLTLGWWWNPIPASELRYTDSEDAVLAGDIVATLRSRGVQVNGPILMGGTGRSRHFELWLSTTIEKAPSGSRTASPSSSVDGLDVKR